ncbi:MAG TPA: hypothetical protein VED01_20565 [Burkholderiales bacterium]|nr:hypothetical protein [Burkholderiales bacterium]
MAGAGRIIRARDSGGRLYVILTASPRAGESESAPPRYELPNRSPVRRISDTEFEVVETGEILLVIS